MILERHLKKYVKGDSSRKPDKSISRGRDDAWRPEPSKANETSQCEDNKDVCHTLNTIAGGFIGTRRLAPSIEDTFAKF